MSYQVFYIMQNNLNIKTTSNTNKIVIKLSKINENFTYITDSLQEHSKIKIPIDNNISKKEKPISIKKPNIIQYKASPVVLDSELNYQELEPEIKDVVDKLSNAQNQQIMIPVCSQWFNMDEIHEIEVNSLPEFFCGKFPSKTPENYKEYRNFIISLYRENPNTYLSSTTCRRNLVGDVCAIIRLHAFLENWGLINFNIDPILKPVNPYIPKSINYKAPVLIDSSALVVKDDNPYGYKIGDNKLVLTNKVNQDLRSLYSISNTTDHLFRSIFNGKSGISPINQINFISRNYRFKCDTCSNLCGFNIYIEDFKDNKDFDFLKNSIVICEDCYSSDNKNSLVDKSKLISSNIYSVLNPNHPNNLKEKLLNEKWSENENLKLIDLINKYGENWDTIEREFNGTRSKNEIITQFIQFPIKENVQFKVSNISSNDIKTNLFGKSEYNQGSNNSNNITSAEHDLSNPLISQLSFFSKMFEKFLNAEKSVYDTSSKEENQNETMSIENIKQIIYKTYAKSIDNSVILKNKSNERMKSILNLLIYISMKKIEMKVNYFNEFEKLLEFESSQVKSFEINIIQERIKFSLKRIELQEQLDKLKQQIKSNDMLLSNNNTSLKGNDDVIE